MEALDELGSGEAVKLMVTAAERDQARRMDLDGLALSEEARTYAAALADRIYDAAGTGKRGRPTKSLVAAVAAVLSDLLRNAQGNPSRWGCRSHGRNAFSDRRVGYRVFKEAYGGMWALGLIQELPGHKQWQTLDGKRIMTWGRLTRSRATPALWASLSSIGIQPNNHDEHFRIEAEAAPAPTVDHLVLRAESVRAGSERYKGHPLPIELSDAMVAALHGRMVRLNAFFADRVRSSLPHAGFSRIFNDGRELDYRWNKGGRIISAGAKSYQRAKKAVRAEMMLNGEAVVEIDVTASHLTILHALRGLEMPLRSDPYQIEGLPRLLVKRWVTMTLGHTGFHRAWPLKVRNELQAKLGLPDLQAAYPIAKVREAITSAIPALSNWKTSKWTWGDLQFLESEAILGTVETLAYDYGVACLPVHDSIIIPGSKRALAEEVLVETFKRVVGVKPTLTISDKVMIGG